MAIIESTQSLVVAPLEQITDQLDTLLRQVAQWRNRALLAETQLRNRRYATIAVLASGALAVILTNDGDYIVLQSIAQFRQPEQALAHAHRAEREMLAGLTDEE